jgi:ABC-2 type transport system ATP-binding protein
LTRAPALAAVPPRPLPAIGPVVLRLSGVVKRWPGQAVPVIGGAELDLRAGSVISIAGANGAGKTTLLRMVAGAIRPDAGEILLDGLSPERDRRDYQARIGFLAAGDHGLYARLTVREQLTLWSRLALLPRPERRAAVLAAVERFGLAELAENRVERLSLGQRQRVRLALAFLHDPRVVLLDEPLNSLDADGTRTVGEALDRLRSRGGVCLWASPEPPQVGIDFERRLVLSEGALSPA